MSICVRSCIISFVNDEMERSVNILRAGGLVAFATETVYGLGADATNALAVRKIFAAKGRPSTNPLIVHVADAEIARRYATAWPVTAVHLARNFWPGPLTMVLPKSPAIVDEVTANQNTVGLRVPNHPVAMQLLRKFDGAIAAPSANRANHISPTSAADVKAELGDSVDLILDGGPCAVGIESTVIDLTGDRPCILRPGGISREQLQAVIGPVDIFTGTVNIETEAKSPGQHIRHYSPATPTFRFNRSRRDQMLLRGIVLIVGSAGIVSPEVKEMPDDPVQYARQLYQTLRAIDERHPPAIFIEMPPDEPQWFAVRDRLMRATVELRIED